MLRAVARAMMPAFIAKGVSATAFRRRLVRQFGRSYRWQTLLGDYREFAGMQRFESAVRSLRPGTKPPTSIMTEVDLRRERRYLGHGDAVYQHVDTGELDERNISMYNDSFESKEAFTDQFVRDKALDDSDPEWRIISVDWYVIKHKKGWSY